MKKLLLIVCIAIAGCGAKSNEELAKDLIQERLKATLPDYSKYTSVNHGALGKAFLSFEESDAYGNYTASLKKFRDSLTIIQELLAAPASTPANKASLTLRQKLLQDSATIFTDSLQAAKMTYSPQQLFTMTHGYKLKNEAGVDVNREDRYYFDDAFTRIIKVNKVF